MTQGIGRVNCNLSWSYWLKANLFGFYTSLFMITAEVLPIFYFLLFPSHLTSCLCWSSKLSLLVSILATLFHLVLELKSRSGINPCGILFIHCDKKGTFFFFLKIAQLTKVFCNFEWLKEFKKSSQATHKKLRELRYKE